MRDLLLGADNESLQQLVNVLGERIHDGHGEVVFDLGFENNGDTLNLSKTEWDVAYGRLEKAAKLASADCQVLLTRNVGGDAEVGAKSKEVDCTGKIMVRQIPETVEEVIETRIAVVGNGRLSGD